MDVFRQLVPEDVRLHAEWLKVMLKRNRDNNLPCFLSPAVFNSIVAGMIKDQIAPLCTALLEQTRTAVSSLIGDIVKESVADDRFPRLKIFLLSSIEESAEKLFAFASTRVTELLEAESHPYSQNHYLFENIAKKRNERLQRALTKALQTAGGGSGKIDVATANAVIQSAFERNRRMSMEDHVAEEMLIILDAYGKVSAKRLIDEVPMIAMMLLSTKLHKDFETCARSVTDSKLKELMAERSDILSRRAKAKEQLLAMEKAQEIFRELSADLLVGV